MIKLGAKELRTTKSSVDEVEQIKKNPIYIIVDNVYDTYNIGSIFRLADAVAAEKVILCGSAEVPPNSRIKKASINTTEWVSWEYAETAVEAINKLKLQFAKSLQTTDYRKNAVDGGPKTVGIQIVAIEQSEKSVRYDQAEYSFPIALVVGNETHGVSKDVLEIADLIVEIPMWGVNRSLNVMVSLGIVLFEAMERGLP